MEVTDLPQLTSFEYGAANCLRTEVRKALDYADMYPNSKAAIKAFFDGVADLADAVRPVNTVAPAITGTAEVGSTLTVTNGTWTGTPAPDYTIQWYADGAAIDGEVASTYDIVEADVGKIITAVVTATNLAGYAKATSNATAEVAEAA